MLNKEKLNANKTTKFGCRGGRLCPPANKQNGITLIALIITIIVMLILVGVTVNIALDGGLFQKANEAKKETIIEAEKEELLSAVVAAIGTDGKVKFEGPDGLDANLPSGWEKTGEKTYKSPKGNIYTVSDDGKITSSGGDNSVPEDNTAKINAKLAWVQENYEEALQEAKNKGQTIEGDNAITDIAIGTDGEIVNLDLWGYLPIASGDGMALAGYASGNNPEGVDGPTYKGGLTEDGAIIGTIPQVFYKANGEILEVKYLSKLLDYGEEKNLRICPQIPSTVEACVGTFSYCSSLIEGTKIPDGVTKINGMYSWCTALTKAPEIPDTVKHCETLFFDCSSLQTAPRVPKNVEKCSQMFSRCTSIKGDIIIDANPSEYHSMLYNVGSSENRITLKGTSTMLEEIRQTGNADYITIAQ